MTLYVDSSAFVKLYLDEYGKEPVEELVRSGVPLTARHTYIEVRRTLYRGLRGSALQRARDSFSIDWRATEVVDIDEPLCLAAADLVEATGVKTLDSLHLAAAQRVGGADLTFLTFDQQQAEAARSLGWTVAGA